MVVWFVLGLSLANLCAEDTYEPGDPIAAIDGDPVYLGELNLILTERFKTRDLEALGIDVQRATATLLVQRHLAMRALEAQGGEWLQGMIRREVEAFAAEARRRGSSLEDQAKARMSNEKSLTADLAWRVAWGQYLKSKLTEANLRRFFESRRSVYGGTRYEVSQIFLKMDGSDAASLRQAIEDLASLAQSIRESDSPETVFADAARQHSQSPTAEQGGRLGWVEKDGDLPRSVMNRVRETPPGQVSDPIQSPLGLHVVFVHQVEAGTRTFDDLVDQSQLRRDAADALFQTLVKSQADAEVVWFVQALRPPPGSLPASPDSSASPDSQRENP